MVERGYIISLSGPPMIAGLAAVLAMRLFRSTVPRMVSRPLAAVPFQCRDDCYPRERIGSIHPHFHLSVCGVGGWEHKRKSGALDFFLDGLQVLLKRVQHSPDIVGRKPIILHGLKQCLQSILGHLVVVSQEISYVC